MNESTEIKNLLGTKIFDPRIIDADDGNKTLWTSESVYLANQGLQDGYQLKDNPYNQRIKGYNLRRNNIPFKYSEDELKIIKLCSKDKILFGNNFTHLKDGEHGWQKITLRNYQENLLKRYSENRYNIIMFPRQSGKTTTTIVEIVHFLCFNVDKDCVVIASTDNIVTEILTKIKECFSKLPFFLQPGFKKFNSDSCELDNGCRLKIGIASEAVVQGYSLDLLYVDEFAFLGNGATKFWVNVYPTLVNNPKSRCIITSTPNGRNLFYELWNNAVLKKNSFVPYKIHWTDVPGRDEKFKKETIENIGLMGWLLGFECSFDANSKSVFETNQQTKLRNIQKNTVTNSTWCKAENLNLPTNYPSDLELRNDIEFDFKNDYFVIGIDIGEGLESDYSVLKIKKIIWNIKNKRLEYKSIGVLRTNTLSVEDFAKLSLRIFKLFNQNNIQVVVETNNYGGEYFSNVDNLSIYDNEFTNINKDIWAKFFRTSKNSFERGIRWNVNNKKLAVKSFIDLIIKKIMEETHDDSIEEYLTFGKQANDTFSANYGHDDLIMPDITLAYFLTQHNMYSDKWLTNVENELRFRCSDEREEIKLLKEKLAKEEANKYIHNGFTMMVHKSKTDKKNTLLIKN